MGLHWRGADRTGRSLYWLSYKPVPCSALTRSTTHNRDLVLLPISQKSSFSSQASSCLPTASSTTPTQSSCLRRSLGSLSSCCLASDYCGTPSAHVVLRPPHLVTTTQNFSRSACASSRTSKTASFLGHLPCILGGASCNSSALATSTSPRDLSLSASTCGLFSSTSKRGLCLSTSTRGLCSSTSTSTRGLCSSACWLSARGETSQLVYKSAAAYGDNIAICDALGQHSYNQLLARSLALSEVLQAVLPPTRKYKHVALLVPATCDYVVALWATWLAGHTAVPLCPQHPPLQLQYFLQDSCCAAVVCCPSLLQLLPPVPSLQKIALDAAPQPDHLTEAQQEAVLEPSFGVVPSTARAMILYTSGTTGDPKGVVLTHGNLSAGMQALQEAWQYCSRDVHLHCLPLHHTHGIVNALMTPLYTGARVVMTHFKPDHIWSLLLGTPSSPAGGASGPPDGDAEGAVVNVFMAVPTIYAKLLDYYDQHYALSEHMRTYVRAACMQNFRLMVSGSAALPASLLVRWREATGVTLLERYGMTEIGMALTNPLRGDRKQGCVGQPFPGVRVRIVAGERVLCEGDSSGTTVTPGCDGQEGELQVKGPTVFSQYWGRPEATRKEFARKGWFKTGDTAIYADGAYQILGRTSVDIIKSGGFKVSALGVERALLDHPHVRDVAVVGPPDRTWGQKISAVLVWSGPTPLDAGLLKEWLKERLPSYQIPVTYTTVPELPRNNMGKVNKKELIKEFF